MKALWEKFKIIIKPFLSWKVLVVYLPIYFISTGWTYIVVALPNVPAGLRSAALAWMAFLWMPWTAEKLVTIPLTIFLYKKIFLNPKKPHKEKDEIAIRNLEELLQNEKEEFRLRRQRAKERRMIRKTKKFINKK